MLRRFLIAIAEYRESLYFSSGMYFVMESSTLLINPSSIAMPTRAEIKDLATEKDVLIESLL